MLLSVIFLSRSVKFLSVIFNPWHFVSHFLVLHFQRPPPLQTSCTRPLKDPSTVWLHKYTVWTPLSRWTGCPLTFLLYLSRMCILLGQTKTSHVLSNTIPLRFGRPPLSNSIYLHSLFMQQQQHWNDIGQMTFFMPPMTQAGLSENWIKIYWVRVHHWLLLTTTHNHIKQQIN